jgi:hypothetical protein
MAEPSYLSVIFQGKVWEKFEDTKMVIRSHKWKKDRQYNGQKKKDRQYNGQKKKTNNDLQSTT